MALDLEPTTSIAALAREASTIDAAALRRRLARHNSGIFALSQTGNIDDMDDQLVERLPALLSALSDHFDYVLVDGVRDFGDTSLSVLDMADDIAMVLTQDVASVRRAARAIKLFRRLGYGDAKLKLILNRATRKTKVDEGEVQRALGLRVSARVRNDFKRMHAALNEGALICDVAPSSGVAKDYAGLASVLGGAEARVAAVLSNTQPVEKQSKLSFLRRKGGK
jgi:pilus assembly protein CpaE